MFLGNMGGSVSGESARLRCHPCGPGSQRDPISDQNSSRTTLPTYPSSLYKGVSRLPRGGGGGGGEEGLCGNDQF